LSDVATPLGYRHSSHSQQILVLGGLNMYNNFNSDTNIAIKVDVKVYFILKLRKNRGLKYVLVPEKSIFEEF
jgi:hypothetical protein